MTHFKISKLWRGKWGVKINFALILLVSAWKPALGQVGEISFCTGDYSVQHNTALQTMTFIINFFHFYHPRTWWNRLLTLNKSELASNRLLSVSFFFETRLYLATAVSWSMKTNMTQFIMSADSHTIPCIMESFFKTCDTRQVIG